MATSKLQRKVSQLLSVHLGQYTIRENAHPDWLITKTGERLELDFYIEEPKVAIEVQGQQHFVFIPHFHKTYTGFEAQLSRDQTKRKICASKKIILYEIVSLDEVFEIVARICPEVQWPIHPKATRQVQLSQERVWVKHYKNEIILQSFKKHKRTPKRHLRRLSLILFRHVSHDGTNTLTPKGRGRIEASLRSLQQYQETKGKIQFNEYENALLRAAQALIDEWFCKPTF